MDVQEIWNATSGNLRSYIITKVKNKMDAEDILHDVFLRFRDFEPTIKKYNNVKAWLFAVTRNAIADFHKRKNPGYQVSDNILQQSNGDETHQLFSNCVQIFIKSLPQKYAEALWLSEIEGLSQKEVAERLGISYSGAKSRIQRGKIKLKEQLLMCCEIETDKYGNIMDYSPRND